MKNKFQSDEKSINLYDKKKLPSSNPIKFVNPDNYLNNNIIKSTVSPSKNEYLSLL